MPSMQNNSNNPAVEVETLSDLLAFFCELFWGPTPDSCPYFLEAAPKQDPDSTEVMPNLASGLSSLAALCAEVDDPQAFHLALESAYVALFINARGSVPAPLYASCHTEGDTFMGDAASRMKQRLSETGLSSTVQGEPPDHLAIQLEYLFFLLQETLGRESAERNRQAASFAQDELLPWVGLLRDKVRDAEDGSREFRFWSLACTCLVLLLEEIRALHR
jgi:putative dimethyl sulfoxide reductase chaperone